MFGFLGAISASSDEFPDRHESLLTVDHCINEFLRTGADIAKACGRRREILRP